jgi:hypothetical protein
MIFFIIYFYRETWPYAWKQNILFYLFILMKIRYLISDLYLYSIKIQTNINQNTVKYLRKIIDFWKEFFEFFCFWAGPNPTHVARLDPAHLCAWSLAQSQWPNYAMHAEKFRRAWTVRK